MTYSTFLDGDDPFSLFAFGLDRTIPDWVEVKWPGPVLDLGPGTKLIPDADRLDYPEHDFDDPDYRLPYTDGSVGGVFAINVLEHLHDPRLIIAECARVLDAGCPLTAFVPHARSGMYLQDLDHKTPFILDSWKNHVDPHPYYKKGRDSVEGLFTVGFNALFAIKEENVCILTQLIRTEEPWQE
jgi:SAM-dependent methyltransferase